MPSRRPTAAIYPLRDIPFNWDATLDWRTLKIGYLPDAFADTDRDPDWKRNEQATLDRLRAMGATLVPLRVPDFDIETVQLSVEAGGVLR